MQRYEDHWLNPNNWLFSSPVCCDNLPDLRQNTGKGPKIVANGFIYSIKSEKNAIRHLTFLRFASYINKKGVTLQTVIYTKGAAPSMCDLANEHEDSYT